RVSAKKYCPAGDLEGGWDDVACNLNIHYQNCPRWCQDHGKRFDKKFILHGGGLFNLNKCVCCCGEPEPVPPPPPPPNNNKWCPPGDIERISVTNICGFDKDYNNCQNWCRDQGRSFTRNKFKRPAPDYDLVDCVCCCGAVCHQNHQQLRLYSLQQSEYRYQ
ncbi:hypothetical protein MKW92_019307, partial [Papaver armeniacum]